MIFLTVGYQMPFDRLVQAVDEWCEHNPKQNIFAQIGPATYQPRHMEFIDFMEPGDFATRFRGATGIIAHAGMGSIISALQHGKPILIMPRHGDLGETRNDHQIDTARRFNSRRGICVAEDETEIPSMLDLLASVSGPLRISDQASPELLAHV